MTVFPISIDGRGNTKGPDTATTQMVGAVVSFLHLLRPQPQGFVLVGSQPSLEEVYRFLGMLMQKHMTAEATSYPILQVMPSISISP